MKNILIFTLFFLFSCGNKEKKYELKENTLKKIKTKYRKNSLLKEKIYLVTGLDGCGACLDYTIKFIEENIDNKEMNFIISGNSKVQLKSKFKYKTIINGNFVFDTSLIALRNGIVGISKPRIFFCNSGKVCDIKDADFRNADSVFTYVKDFIKK